MAFRLKLTLAALLAFFAQKSIAQLNPFQYMYYQNRYMLNPAFAGLDKGLNLNLGYRQQWSNFPGTPKTAAFTGDYQATNKVGIGLNVLDDQSGLIRTTKVVGTYAYHVQLSDRNQYLNFGASIGINNSRIDQNKITGDVTDQQITQYNMLKPYVDGDFGAAYTDERLMISVALPNLRSTLQKASDTRFDSDMLTFAAAASYKVALDNDEKGLSIEPLAAFRAVKGYKNIVDAGFSLSSGNYGLYLQGIYHTNNNTSIGIGIDQKAFGLNFAYNIETGTLSNYSRGAFELGLKLNLFNKEKAE